MITDTAIAERPAAEQAGMPTPDAILQLGFAFWQSKTLLSAVELGLFTLLEEAGPLPAEAIDEWLSLHPRARRDFLDALVALRMLRRDAEGRYANTPETAHYLVRSRPSYVGGMLEMANACLYPYWGRLTDGLRTGQPQNEIRDDRPGLFEALYADPAALEGFLRAMTGLSRPTARAMAGLFPWKGHRSVADIGCAQGGCLAEILRAHPHLEGLGFDLPQVGPVFEAFAREQGLERRMRFRTGNFFTDPLPAADVLVMGHIILHDWDLAEKLALLRKAHAALPPGGALIVYDAMIDDERRENAYGLLMSLNMLIETPGGFDYTGADCAGWMREAGFRSVRVQPLQGPYAMAVGLR